MSELDLLQNRIRNLEKQVRHLSEQNLILTNGLIETLKQIRSPNGEEINRAIATLRTLTKQTTRQ